MRQFIVKAGKALAWLVAGLLASFAILGIGGLFVWDTPDYWASSPSVLISFTLVSSFIVYNLVGEDRLRENVGSIKEWIAEEGATCAVIGVVAYLIGGLWQ